MAEPLPYFCYLSSALQTSTTQIRGYKRNPLTDQQIQQIYTAISYSPNSLQVLAGFQQRYPRLLFTLQIRKYWTAEMACTENRMQQLLYMLATAFQDLDSSTKNQYPEHYTEFTGIVNFTLTSLNTQAPPQTRETNRWYSGMDVHHMGKGDLEVV